MSRHQAFRNYDYENDLDEYEGGFEDEEEISQEDRDQMAAATAKVQEAMGSQAAFLTTDQIQEALWHYYYDVEKSVAYLTKKFISPPKEKKATEWVLPVKVRHSEATTFSSFFSDMPWLAIPQDRVTDFIEPERPRGSWGLLGGSGAAPAKMSKLQALALARKKKAEEAKTQDAGPDMQSIPKKVQELSLVESQANASKTATPGLTVSSGSAPTDSADTQSTQETIPEGIPKVALQEIAPAADAAEPSAFAQALMGSTPVPSFSRNQYPVPYMSFTTSIADAFSEPSPDDVVLKAQSKASNKKLAATSTKKKDKLETATDGLKTLKVDDTPLPKSKNLDVLREYEKSKAKKSASFVVVGHVDAGKSTLMGRLLLDLEVVDQRTIDKYRKEAESMGKSSFALAWVLDQRTEERTRGVTIDIATNKFETETTSFTILDAPGHRDFIPNMIAGASQADFAILVVDASTGAFEAGLRGQTREHALLLRSMGVSRIIVAVNKLDTVGWSRERFDEISQQVSGFLSGSGFQLKNVSFVPVSGLQGDNMVRRSADPAADWYKGDTLITELENSEPMTRALEKPLRMTISEVFRTTQSPITISGRLDAGSAQAGDAILVQPSGEKAYIKSLELDGEPVDWAVAGQNVVIHLTHIDPIHVRVGDIVCDTRQPIACIDSFTIKVLAFDILMPMQIDVHRGRLHAAGQIAQISALLDKTKGTVLKNKPKIVKPASVARITVKLATKVPLEAGQRVILRSNGSTVAAGLLD